MEIKVHTTTEEMAKAAATTAAKHLNEAIREKGQAVFIAATGASQFEFLNVLCGIPSINWDKTIMFHLDEYIGLPETHPASFRKYLKERLIDKVHPGRVHLLQGDSQDPKAECARVGNIINQYEVDVAFVGIGENGHLAFNDPPADFDTEDPYLVVNLDDRCRQQQVGEGWFSDLSKVPQKAISMTIHQIMESRNIICTVPTARKAEAVQKCFATGTVSPNAPASILQEHDRVMVFLDKDSAKLLPTNLKSNPQ